MHIEKYLLQIVHRSRKPKKSGKVKEIEISHGKVPGKSGKKYKRDRNFKLCS